jgi:hypothetical protein
VQPRSVKSFTSLRGLNCIFTIKSMVVSKKHLFVEEVALRNSDWTQAIPRCKGSRAIKQAKSDPSCGCEAG